MYPKMFNRDEIFFRLGVEKSEELLEKIRNLKNPNFQDAKGISYLHRAWQTHYIEAIKILLELGANPNIADERGFSPVLEAIGTINEKNNDILELMLKFGLDLDRMEGNTTLKEMIESFKDEEFNKIIKKYYHK